MNDAELLNSDEGKRLRTGLLGARRAVLIRRLRSDFFAGVEWASIVVCAAALLVSLRIVASYFAVIPTREIGVACVLVTFGVLAVLAWKVLPGLASPPSFAEVAERLDLATDGGNRIATAEELLRSPVGHPFEAGAISDGLRHLERVQHVAPFESPVPRRSGRIGLFLVVAVGLILATLLRPRSIVPSERTGESGPFAAAVETMPGPAESLKRLERRPEPAARPTVAAGSGESAKASSGKAVTGVVKAESSSAAAAAAGTSVPMATATADPASRSTDSRHDESAEETGVPAVGQAPSAAAPPPPPPPAATPADAGASGAARSAAANTGGTKPKSARSKSGKEKSSEPPNGGGASGASAPPPDAPPPDPDKAGDGDGGDAASKTDQPIPNSGGFSSSPSKGTDEKGDGRTVGEGQPKKSRGVAPLMLGVRQPDLFQGRHLPGPDERTKLLLPSKRDPREPAAAADAALRTSDETTSDRYAVSGELRGAVNAYFRSFHAQPNSAASGEKP